MGLWSRAGAAAALCAALLAGEAVPAHEPEEPDAPAAVLADPPGRVGRVSALVGSVDLSQGAGAPWEPARINQPVTGQTALFAPPGSQAELRIGSASVRLDAETQAAFSRLDDQGIAIELAQGTVRARVRNLPAGDSFVLAADGVQAAAQRPGDYRVAYDPDHRAFTVRAFAGELRLLTPGGSYKLEPGQEIVVEDGGETVRLRPPAERDAFDAWAEARDGQQDVLASARHVSPETTGIEALDEHGSWDTTEEYGAVWYPRSLPSGWAPYRYGHWAHVQPWGWTWVDDAPWGFAPFHYGRWAWVDSRWGWVPGPVVARPVWAPALVGYVGGSRLAVGIGAPIGWFPLGPHEIYHPPYRYSQRHWDQVNRREKHRGGGKHRDPDHRDGWRGEDRRMQHHAQPGYRYAKRPDALTVVSADGFRGSRSVARERLPLDAGQIAQLAPMSPGLRLPDATPRLGNGAAFGQRPAGEPPALGLPALPERGLRQAGGDRRMLARPPGLERRGSMPRDERLPVSRGARADRDFAGEAFSRPQPRQVPAPSLSRPALSVSPPRAVRRPVPPMRAAVPDRPAPSARPAPPATRVFTPAPPARSLPFRSHVIQPPMQTVPGLMQPRAQPPAHPGLLRAAPAPRPNAVRGGDRGGRAQAPGPAQRPR